MNALREQVDDYLESMKTLFAIAEDNSFLIDYHEREDNYTFSVKDGNNCYASLFFLIFDGEDFCKLRFSLRNHSDRTYEATMFSALLGSKKYTKVFRDPIVNNIDFDIKDFEFLKYILDNFVWKHIQ